MNTSTITATSEKLTTHQLEKIMQEHSLPFFLYNGRLFGVMPYLCSNTLESGFDITDITNFTREQIRNYLGY